MASSPAEGERTYATLLKACESFLKISPKLAGVIRRDGKVKDAIRHQVPILTRHPNSPAAEDVEALARRLGSGK
jgi:flagellar biosynthesis protein FlhG